MKARARKASSRFAVILSVRHWRTGYVRAALQTQDMRRKKNVVTGSTMLTISADSEESFYAYLRQCGAQYAVRVWIRSGKTKEN